MKTILNKGEKIMKKYRLNLVFQKLIGIGILLFVWSTLKIVESDGLVLLLPVVMGLDLLFTKKDFLKNDYFFMVRKYEDEEEF